MKASNFISAMFVLMCTMLASLSFAQEPTAQQKESARNYLDVGDAALDKGNLEEAHKAYKAADDIMKVPTTGIEVAKTLAKLGRLIEAKQKAVDIVLMPLQPNEPSVFAEAREEAKKLRDEISARIPSIKVTITGLKEGVTPTVKVDGTPLQTFVSGLPFRVNPGTHQVHVAAPGYKSVGGPVTVKESKTAELELGMVKDPNWVPPKVEPGKPPNQGTTQPAQVPQPPPQPADKAEKSGGVSPLVYIGFGIGGAGIIVGAITGGMSIAKQGELDEVYGCEDGRCNVSAGEQSQFDSDLKQATLLANISNVGFALAGAGTVLGVIGLFLDTTPEKKADAISIRPTVSLGGAGLVGTF